MYFRIALSFSLLCLSVSSTPLRPQSENVASDYKTMVDVLDYISSGVQRTTQDITNWRGDYQGADLLASDLQNLLNSVVQGSVVISSTSAVTTWDSTGFLNPTYKLNNNLDAMVDILIQKKGWFDGIGRTQGMQASLVQIRNAAGTLSQAIESKLPYVAWIVAQPVVSTLMSKVDKAATSFKQPPVPQQQQPPNQAPWQNQPPQNQPPPNWQQAAPPQQAPNAPAWQQGPPPQPQPQNPEQGPTWYPAIKNS